MKPLYIFDLDGTLALIEHRRHFVERESGKQDWKGFFAACVNDQPNAPVVQTLENLRRLCDVWIWSGRSEEVREATVEWIAHNTSFISWTFDPIFGEKNALKMRTEGDYTPDEVLKRGWLKSLSPHDRQRLVAVFDDRDKVVQMWRDEGVACFQVAQGAF